MDDDYFVIVRPTPNGVQALVSDATMAVDDDFAAEILTELDAEIPDLDPDELDDVDGWADGDFELLADLGLSEEVLGVIADDDDLWPSEQLVRIAEELGFADELVASRGSTIDYPREGLGARSVSCGAPWRWPARRDVPVGAVLYRPDGRELAVARIGGRPTAIDRACGSAGDRRGVDKHGDAWRLTGFARGHPGAIPCARARYSAQVKLIFRGVGAETGACGSLIDAVRAPGQLHRPQVRGGVLEGECAALLEGFFESLR